MNEIAIKRHSFDSAINSLKEFTEKTEDELEIAKVQTDGGFFGLGDHKVTGDELNKRLETIQKHFIAVNATNNKVIKAFREVYNALNVLDKDYITSIVANVKAIEKTSNDVRVQQGTLKQHNEKLANQQSKLDAHQAEIEKYVAYISKIVTVLKDFKEKLVGYSHLQDIDNMWDDLDVCKKNIEKINENIQTQQSELNNLATTSKNHTESIATLSKKMVATEEYAVDSRNLITKLEAFKEEVSALNHLMEVDEIWKQTEEHQTRINRVEQECKANTDKLSGISHLDDVDGMWNNVEEHTSKLIKCEKRDEEIADAIQKNKEEVNENIAEAVRTANAAIETLTKKVKYAYWIAGGTAGLAIIELILLLV